MRVLLLIIYAIWICLRDAYEIRCWQLASGGSMDKLPMRKKRKKFSNEQNALSWLHNAFGFTITKSKTKKVRHPIRHWIHIIELRRANVHHLNNTESSQARDSSKWRTKYNKKWIQMAKSVGWITLADNGFSFYGKVYTKTNTIRARDAPAEDERLPN